MTRLTVVVIDDESVFRSVLTRSLTKLACEVYDFDHPRSALQTISELKKPVVLLDLKLDDDSGLRWIQAIKQANSQVSIILLTAYASISTAVEAIKLGADDYLAKPITAREILTHLNKPTQNPDMAIEEKPMSVDRLEWEHIQKVLTDNQGNVSATARALGMHRRTLQRKLAKKPAKC
ncbi:response regulator [Aliikangiella marina]|uniref:Response regulator n=1 Tax=Aliikangiella marina TaxID=1712262 RepID=A0A545T1E8_9GAMM|nr:response regulator [Aliikangiella marina]TQV71019.1 response regulator [Aliikangiella marina]